MLSTANMLELHQAINTTHADPHHILGMHEIKIGEKDALCVRAFIPQAKSIKVLDIPGKNKAWTLEKIHEDGFFEGIITGRKKWFRYRLEIEDYEGNNWITYDPYSFEPVISELDRFLFGQGTHYKIFDKLGAHLMEIDGISGVLFAVWAPNARRVSVVGDFNAWDGRRNVMRLLEKSGIWELFVPGLVQNDNYKYEIKTHSDSIIRKTDPFGNFAARRPSTNSIVFDIDSYKWNDSKWYKKLNKNIGRDIPMNIYELHMGSWQRGEDNRYLTYDELAEQLIPYVKEMGYTHIELMPIEEYPFIGSWGYQTTGYYAPTSRYGNPVQFMHFVDQCHQNDIGVILDWVPAHFPKDDHGLAKFDGTALYEHEDPRKGEQPQWGTLIFNYGRSEVKNFLIGNAIFWLEKYHIDGLRVDAVAAMLYLDYCKKEGEWTPNQYGGNCNSEAVDFIKHMNSIISKNFPHALMIAEESTSWAGVSRPVEDGGLGFHLKWNMGWMNDFLSYVEQDPLFRRYHHNKMTFGLMYAYTENFILVLSHDEVVHGKKSMLDKMPGDLWQKCANLRLAYGFMMVHPGKKLLFMGGEFGQFIEWDEKRPLDWFLLEYPHHKQIQDFVKDLNHLYIKERALWFDDFRGTGFEWIDCNDGNRSIFSMMRKSDKQKDMLIIICNFTPNPVLDYRVGVPFNGSYNEILNSDEEKYGGSGIINEGILKTEDAPCNNHPYSIELKLPPLGVTVLKQ